jgi:cell division protein FtsB
LSFAVPVPLRRQPLRRRRSARRALAGLRELALPSSLSITEDDTTETRRRKHRAAYAIYVITALIALGVALVVWVFPTRTWLDQRGATSAEAAKVAVIDQQSHQLERQIRALDTDAEIERVARERYGLAFPGEQTFALLPASLPKFPVAFGFNVLKAYFTVSH